MSATGLTHVESKASFNWPGRGLSVALALIGSLVLAWISFMGREWVENPDLSHGLLSPLLAVLLLYDARKGGPRRFLKPGWTVHLILLGGLIAAEAILLFAGLMAAALAWSNALTAFLLGAGLSTLLLSALLVCAQNSVRVLPFTWSAFVACLLPVLSAPIPPGTYSRLTLALQLGVTSTVLTTLRFLGIPAQQVGNVIELASTRVGVEEACSGIRSLVSCVVAALFFSGTLVTRPWARVVLVLLAPPLAIAMNFVRSLGLTFAANDGVEIGGTVHTVSGFVGLGVCTAVLAWIARSLERPLAPRWVESPLSPRTRPAFVWPLVAAASIAVATVGTFAWKTRPAPYSTRSAPDLARALPTTSNGWAVETNEDLYRFSSTLKTHVLAQRTYSRTTPGGPQQFTVYLAFWLPGEATVSLVTSHTPDACWPGVGWTAQSDRTARTTLATRRVLPPAEYRTFTQGERLQHVWFWHLYDGKPITGADPFSPLKMARMVMRYGVQSEADQLFVRFSSNVPWSAFAQDPLTEEIVDRLQTLGL